MLQRRPRAVNERLVAVVLTLAAVSPAHAQDSPERARAERIGRELLASPRGEAAVVLVEELFATWDQAGPGPVVPVLEAVARDPRAPRELRDAAAHRLAEARLRTGSPEEARSEADRLGVVRRVAILGPLDNRGDAGPSRAFPPEEQLGGPLDLGTPVEGLDRPVSWRSVEVPDPLGVIRLSGYLGHAEDACAFVATAVELDRPTEAELRASAGGALVLWLNDREVVRDEVHRALHPDRFAVSARLPRGVSRVVAKVCGGEEPPSLVLRLTGRGGAPLGAAFSGSGELLSRAPSRGPLPRRIATPFTRFWRRAEARGRGDLLLAARYLHRTGGDDPSSPLAPDLAAGAVALRAEVEGRLLAASLARDRNAAAEQLRRAAEEAPDDPLVSSALARLLAEGPNPHRALPLTGAVLERWPGAAGAAETRARLLGGLGLPLAGLAVIDRAIEAAGPAPALLALATRLAIDGREPRRAAELAAVRSRLRFDAAEVHRVLAEGARDRSEPREAAAALEALETVAWHEASERAWVARLYEQLGFEERAEASLAALIAQVPDSHEGHAGLARLLAGLGRADEAVEPARRGLALRPQESGLRDLLAHLLRREPFEDAFVEEPEAFLARRGSAEGEHAVWLLDSTVVRVHPSGLSSRFRQVAIEVQDEQGARDQRTQGIVYVPDEQEVTLRRARVLRRDGTVEEASGRYEQRLSDPQVRMYYDERAQVVELPRLRPGDVVELAYRVDDVGARNLLGDYFGDLVLLQGFEPRRRVSYVLVHPPGRRLQVAEPELPGLARSESCDEERCVLRWSADDVPAVRREDGMPALAELGARLHVSSYGEWERIGRWYWGLVRDQLVPDEALRRVVAELTAGLADDEERVRAVHRWVVERTRYVALEFGIHGYQPYRVTQVVERGFGDCKDKASLLVTMLRLAGVEASLVLLRTRGGGRVPPEPPSLAIFDHAIAYVPSLDLYLDGTAEQSGTRELPWMDQGATALVVAPGGESRLVTTPLDPPERNVEARRLSVRLRPDGSALVESRVAVQGAEAARHRFHFQAPALRAERLETALGASWPGARLLEHTVNEIADRERPVDFAVAFEAPRAALRRGDGLAAAPGPVLELTRRHARRSSRRWPLELGTAPHVVDEHRTIVPPEGMSVRDVPEDVSLASPFGSLEVSSRRDGRQVSVRTRLVVSVDRVAPEDYPAFRRFCQAVDEALERRVVLGD